MAEEGYREACSYHLCPLCGGRRVQTSLLLSPVPTLWRKESTEKLAPISCANAVAEEGYREQNKNTTREDNKVIRAVFN